jgi:uncharacterized protein (DUF362 family)
MGRPFLRSEWTRREILALPFAAAVAAATACRPRFDRAAFVVPARSAVGLFPAADYRVRGKRVLLKPNLVEYESGSCINTHPLVVAGAAVAMLRAGAATVAVGEGPGHRRDIEYLLVSSGLYDQLKDLRIPFVDLNHDDVSPVRLKSWFTGLQSILLPASVLSADLVVSVAKLKTHHWAGMTCGMKNLFGIVPGSVYGWPKNFLHNHGIPESIVDLNATIRPGLTIVDAVVAMEGDGPIMGSARPMGFIAMGTDTVAVDATCARVIGLAPDRLTYLKSAAEFLGNIDEGRIDQRGEAPARYRSRFAVVESLRGLKEE